MNNKYLIGKIKVSNLVYISAQGWMIVYLPYAKHIVQISLRFPQIVIILIHIKYLVFNRNDTYFISNLVLSKIENYFASLSCLFSDMLSRIIIPSCELCLCYHHQNKDKLAFID